MLEGFFNFLEWARRNQVIGNFVERDLTGWIFISLMFGFIVLLFELRLPLKYYWNIPVHAFLGLLESIGLRKKTPTWGYCLDRISKQIIPIAAVELIEPETKKSLYLTYSNRLGQYGFQPKPGKYYLRAIKKQYQVPSILDPENIQLVEVKESYTTPVKIAAGPASSPQLNLELQPIEKFDPQNPRYLVGYFSRKFLFALANGFLGLATVLSFFAWALTKSVTFGLLLTVSITLLFIKIYILEAISRAVSL